MSLKQRIHDDIARCFMNGEHFASEHYWNGLKIVCVVDDDEAIKRKNNSLDVSWDNNTTEKMIYAPMSLSCFADGIAANQQVVFDGKIMRVLQFNENAGVYGILLVSSSAREIL